MSRTRPGSGRDRRLAIRVRRLGWWTLALLVVALVSRLDRGGHLLVPRADDLDAYQGRTTRVIRVIDGDTIDVDVPDLLNNRTFTRIRLWGLDCPEAATADRAAEPWADEATAFVKDLLEGGSVTLDLESHRERGTFGRVLAHVNIPEQGSLNVLLLEAGLAYADERWAHKHLQRYAKAQRQAKLSKVGVWSDPLDNAAGDD